MPPLLVMALLAGGLLLFLNREASASVHRLPGAPLEPVDPNVQRPTTEIPDDVQGSPVRRSVTGPSGNVYTVDLFPPNADDRTFAIAQLAEWHAGGTMNVQPYVNWVRYYQDRQTQKRETDRLYARTGNPEHDQVVMAVMESDFRLA